MMSGMADSDSGAERRRSRRVDFNLLVQYRFDSFEEFKSEYAADLSEGGLFIETEEPHKVGEVIYLQFALPDGTRLIEGLGRVVRVVPPGSEQPGMGIQFVNMDGDSQDLVQAAVRERTIDIEKP